MIISHLLLGYESRLIQVLVYSVTLTNSFIEKTNFVSWLHVKNGIRNLQNCSKNNFLYHYHFKNLVM